MFKNFILLAFRNIKNNKAHALINILGLSIGLACCILIFLWVHHELSFDKFHSNYKNIYRIVEEQYQNNEPFPVAVTPTALGPFLQETYPAVVQQTRIQTFITGYVSYADKKFRETNIVLADPSFFEIFDFNLKKGSLEEIFENPFNLIISEKMAKKYFGNEDPIGKIINFENQIDLKVLGVVENPQDNSHLQFGFVVPFTILEAFGTDLDDWGANSYYTYIQLEDGVDYKEFEARIKNVLTEHECGYPVIVQLQPLQDIHLKSDYVADIHGQGNILYVRLFSLVALFVLIIACINFMNLATACAENRAREVGIKKVVGSQKNILIRQFLGESVILAIISLIFAGVIVELLIPLFNNIAGKELSFLTGQGSFLYIFLIAVTLFTGIFAGSYPAFVLSSFKPINVLKGTLKAGKKGVLFRRILVILQFAITIILIIGTIVVFKQVQFVHNKELGYTKEQVLTFIFREQSMENYKTLKNELLKLPQVQQVSKGNSYPYSIIPSGYGYDWRTKENDERILVHNLNVDYDFFKTLDIEFVQGRAFSPNMPTDSSAIIINETAAAMMKFEDPLSEQVTDHYQNNQPYNIIGVVKDFHFKKLQTEIEPLFITLSSHSSICFVRLDTEDMEGTIAQIKSIWNDINPSTPLEYTFLDENYAKLYRAEQRMLTIFNYFTITAILISCLGLFGLISYLTERRTREIGIRKVMGASVKNIVFLLTEESVKWVLIANLFAWPVAYLVMSKWLNTFVYKVPLHFTYFLLAGVLSLIIAVLTISFQTIRAALRNPSDSMRYE